MVWIINLDNLIESVLCLLLLLLIKLNCSLSEFLQILLVWNIRDSKPGVSKYIGNSWSLVWV